jgi:hypothetical protein
MLNETLITLKEAAEDFAGVKIPLNTVQKYIYTVAHLKLVFANLAEYVIKMFRRRSWTTINYPKRQSTN